MNIKLTKPLVVKGQQVSEIKLDFTGITGKELIEAENEARAIGDQSPSVFLSMRFQAILAAKIIGVPVDDLLALPAEDFRKLVLPVANFLLG